MSWKTYALPELAELSLGKMLDQHKNRGILMPHLSNLNVRWGEIELDDLRQMRFEEHELQRFGLRYGDIVMCEGGEPGRCAIWLNKEPGPMLQKALHRIRPRDGVYPQYLFYNLFHQGRTGLFRRLFTGATILHMPAAKLAQVEVQLPPIGEQRRIAGILSAYDELIANNQRRIAVLEQMARALYREWFVYFRAPGVVLKDGEDLPEGWEVKKLGAIADIRKGLSYKGEFLDDVGGQPMVNLKCITPGGGFRRDGVKGYTGPFKDHQAVRPGDIVFANTDLTQAGFIIGSAAIVPRLGFEEGGLATHHICIAHEKLGVASKCFLYFALNDERFREFARGRASGTTVLGFRTSDAEDFEVQLPPSQTMERFTSVVQPILDLIETLAEKTSNLRRTRDLLLPRLMSGRVEVGAIKSSVS